MTQLFIYHLPPYYDSFTMVSLSTRAETDPALCERYAQFASHMVRWEFKIIYWTLFISNLFVLFLASWAYTRYVASLLLCVLYVPTLTIFSEHKSASRGVHPARPSDQNVFDSPSSSAWHACACQPPLSSWRPTSSWLSSSATERISSRYIGRLGPWSKSAL